MRRFLIVAFLMGTVFSIARAEPAKPLNVVIGCAAGKALTYGWITYEDRDGDGAYDFATAMSCDGVMTWGPLGQVIGTRQLDFGDLTGLTMDFVSAECGSNNSWTVNLYSGQVEVCEISVTCSAMPETTCPDLPSLGQLSPGDIWPMGTPAGSASSLTPGSALTVVQTR